MLEMEYSGFGYQYHVSWCPGSWVTRASADMAVFKIRSETCRTEAQFCQNLYMVKKENMSDWPRFCRSGSAVWHLFWRLTWYWLCRTHNIYCCSRVDFNYLGQAKSKIWFKMWIFCNLSNNSACYKSIHCFVPTNLNSNKNNVWISLPSWCDG